VGPPAVSWPASRSIRCQLIANLNCGSKAVAFQPLRRGKHAGPISAHCQKPRQGARDLAAMGRSGAGSYEKSRHVVTAARPFQGETFPGRSSRVSAEQILRPRGPAVQQCRRADHPWASSYGWPLDRPNSLVLLLFGLGLGLFFYYRLRGG
jgi:hypothetical protein